MFAVNVMSSSKYSSASGYLNETFLNSTVPTKDPSVLVPSFITSGVFITSLIRLALTLALGTIINIIASIKNDNITCMA